MSYKLIIREEALEEMKFAFYIMIVCNQDWEKDFCMNLKIDMKKLGSILISMDLLTSTTKCVV